MPEGNPFNPAGGGVFQVQPTDLLSMLQTAFPTAPMPTKMALPNTAPQEAQMIDLGAGGPAPGAPRSNFLSGLGSLVGQAGQIYGAAKAAQAPASAPNVQTITASGTGKPVEVMTIGSGRGYAVTLPTLPQRTSSGGP